MHFLFLFLDGVGLGVSDPDINPFARAHTPTICSLLEYRKLTLDSLSDGPLKTQRATLTALDACLGVDGLPQSATGQAVLLTGVNVPAQIGYHYGPKPNPDVAQHLKNGNLFNTLTRRNYSSALLNAYPPAYFSAIQSRRRIYSSIPLAVTSAGLDLKTQADLTAGQAMAADFTGDGWHSHLKVDSTPRLKVEQAGARLADLAKQYDFSLFEFWLSDYAGHKQQMQQACDVVERLDQILYSLLDHWEDKDGLILITSDHGNLEDLRVRRHTTNPVPALLIGSPEERARFPLFSSDITAITPGILSYLESARNER